jgi:hypothetical protein
MSASNPKNTPLTQEQLTLAAGDLQQTMRRFAFMPSQVANSFRGAGNRKAGEVQQPEAPPSISQSNKPGQAGEKTNEPEKRQSE